MTSVLDMAEAHIINVQRELQQLEKRKEDVQAEIDRLTQYLGEAAGVVETAKSEAQAALAGSATSTSTEREFPFQSVTS